MGICNVKKGYGVDKANFLYDKLCELSLQGETETYVFQEGLAILWAYIEFQESDGIDVHDLRKRVLKLGESRINNAGYRTIKRDTMLSGMRSNFDLLVNSKNSIREMSKSPVTIEEIEKAVRLASRAPSACNRQPTKVYYSLDDLKNKELSKIIQGNKGFESDILYYSVVTVDRTLFRDTEMFQWYVNGGIFLAYYILALHSIGIASCIFQWPQFNQNENRLRELIRSHDKEAIVAIVGFGKYPETTKCICAERKPVEEIAKVF